MAHNQFLMDFMKMREQLKEKEVKNTISKPKVKPLGGMSKPSEPNITLATIIEEKPKKDKVIEYLCYRRDCIMEEMDD